MSDEDDDFMSEESYEFEFEDDDEEAHSQHLQEEQADHSVVCIGQLGKGRSM